MMALILEYKATGAQDVMKGGATIAYNLMQVLYEKGLLTDQDLRVMAAATPGLYIKEES